MTMRGRENLNDDEQKRRPERGDKKKTSTKQTDRGDEHHGPNPRVSGRQGDVKEGRHESFEAEEASTENILTCSRRTSRGGNSRNILKAGENGFGAREASLDMPTIHTIAPSSTYRAGTATATTSILPAPRLTPFEDTMVEDNSVVSSNEPLDVWNDEEHTFPGAQRSGPYGNDTILTGDDDGHGEEESSARSSGESLDVMAHAQLVESGVDWRESVDVRLQLSQAQNSKRRQLQISSAIGLILVATIIVLSVFLSGESGGGGDDASHGKDFVWLNLIQSKMPSTTFYEPSSPQRRALNWMLRDSFTLALGDDKKEQIIQRFALAVFYFSTNGPTTWNLDGGKWVAPSTECEWASVTCAYDQVDGVNLDAKGLSGSLPDEIGLLSVLTGLSLHNNSIVGTIPEEIGFLSKLTQLDLDNNKLEGTLPSKIGFLSALRGLSLNNNNLQGRLPSEVGLLWALTSLSLDSNNLQGTLPSQIGSLSSLTATLSLRDNSFQGTIPAQIGKLSGLAHFHINNNKVEGTIPSELGLLSALRSFDLSVNNLNGKIPTQIGWLSGLTGMGLSDNRDLLGSVPTELVKLSKLVSLQLYSTKLSGSIPSSLCAGGKLTDARIECSKVECDCCTASSGVSC